MALSCLTPSAPQPTLNPSNYFTAPPHHHHHPHHTPHQQPLVTPKFTPADLRGRPTANSPPTPHHLTEPHLTPSSLTVTSQATPKGTGTGTNDTESQVWSNMASSNRCACAYACACASWVVPQAFVGWTRRPQAALLIDNLEVLSV